MYLSVSKIERNWKLEHVVIFRIYITWKTEKKTIVMNSRDENTLLSDKEWISLSLG